MVLGALLIAAQLSRFDGYPASVSSLTPEKTLATCIMPSTNFWAKDFDFSCVSPWNSASGRLRAGTAISPRHVVFANHFPVVSGARMIFIGEDGGVCPCTLAKTARVGTTDIIIGALDYDLTPNIKPAKVMPKDWLEHVAGVTNFPTVTFTQNETLLYSEFVLTSTNFSYLALRNRAPDHEPIELQGPRGSIAVPEEAIQRHGMIRVGDSGNPAFMVWKGEPVLMYCLLNGGAGSGPWLHLRLKEIQETMDELAPGYQLNVVDLKQ